MITLTSAHDRSLRKVAVQFVLVVSIAAALCALFGNFDPTLFGAMILLTYNIRRIVIKINYEIPIRDFFGLLFTVQFLVGPALVYNVFADFQLEAYRMRVPKEEYFSFVYPAILLFHLGLKLGSGNSKIRIDVKSIQKRLELYENWAYYFLAIGVLASLVAPFFPGSLQFIFYLLGGFKYCAIFMLILRRKKVPLYIVVLVFGSLVVSAFSILMFHDLLIWIIYLSVFFVVRYQWSLKIKLLGVIGFLMLAAFLQVIKSQLRTAVWGGGNKVSSEIIQDVASSTAIRKKGLFSKEALAPQLTRINQGWIISSIMHNVPARIEHTEGSLMLTYIEAAFLPRFLAPNKLKAGDYKLFTKYSGHTINQGTSMGLSPVGDGYIDFGLVGGVFFMFFYGYIYGFALKKYSDASFQNDFWVIFIPLVFIYPIRPDCETQTAFGHFIKAAILVWILVKIILKNSDSIEADPE